MNFASVRMLRMRVVPAAGHNQLVEAAATVMPTSALQSELQDALNYCK
jgi:hypothetical protein